MKAGKLREGGTLVGADDFSVQRVRSARSCVSTWQILVLNQKFPVESTYPNLTLDWHITVLLGIGALPVESTKTAR